jgi:biotin carboxyl carrier protein
MARYTLIAPEAPAATTASSPTERLVTCDVDSLAVAAASSSALSTREFEVTVEETVVRAALLDVGPPWLFLIDGKPCEVVAEPSGAYRVLSSGVALRVATGKSRRPTATAGAPCLIAPMPGRIVRVLCQTGDVVEAGAPLVVLEAMKMENELVAPARGRVVDVLVREGSAVEARAKLVTLAEP